MNLDLSDKNALVCGASAGIGAASARALAALGARVTLVARNAEKLTAILQSLENQQEGHDFLVADFSDPENLKAALAELPKDRPYHILINNTGGPKGGPIYSANTEEFTKAFAQHLVNNQILSQTLVPGMQAEGYGRIINIISTSVKQPSGLSTWMFANASIQRSCALLKSVDSQWHSQHVPFISRVISQSKLRTEI